MKATTIEHFLAKAIAKHGYLYDYSQSVYDGPKKPIIIICPDHGPWQERSAYMHYRGCGCPDCCNDLLSKDPFHQQAAKVHGDKYSIVDQSDLARVIMECQEHGQFSRTATEICHAVGCAPCGMLNKQAHRAMTTEEFIQRALKIHGKKFDYSQSIYTKSSEPINIICSKHGLFSATPSNHLKGHVCNLCACAKVGEAQRHTMEWFLHEAQKLFGDVYTYADTKYEGMQKHVTITCPTHGDFEQMPENFLRGYGCRQCSDKHPGRYSQKACECLDQIAAAQGIHIQHALNGGEHYIKQLRKKVDGYCAETHEVYEFHGVSTWLGMFACFTIFSPCLLLVYRISGMETLNVMRAKKSIRSTKRPWVNYMMRP